MACRTTRLNLQCVRVLVGELEGAKAETRVVHADDVGFANRTLEAKSRKTGFSETGGLVPHIPETRLLGT
jgi:hypothetical protein